VTARAAGLQGFGLIFYGDSITESWRGTSAMRPAEQYAGNRAAFAQHFETKFNAAALGVSGDQLPHLLWRLAHGEFPDRHPPKLAVLLIGTNDLAWARHQGESRGGGGGDAMAEAVPGVAREVLRAVHFIQARAPATKVLLLGLLPRGDERGLRQPSLFSPAIQEVNMHFEQYASQDGRVEYLDCTASLLVKGGGAIDEAKMPDGLHPAGPGAQALARCLRPVVERLMA
jgi:lysophospholipase L1-like esterase